MTLLSTVTSSLLKRSILQSPQSITSAAAITTFQLTKKYLSTASKQKSKKNILLVGCNGTLGSSILSNKKPGYNVIGTDILVPPSDAKIDHFIQIPLSCHHSIEELNEHLHKHVTEYLHSKNNDRLDGILCTCGGFEMDPMQGDSENGYPITTHDYATNFDKMLKANLYPVIVSSLIGMELLNKHGLFLTLGAAAALDASPNMTAYGLSKNANHFLVQTLGNTNLATKPYSALTKAYNNDVCALSILPSILDTPKNRKDMPDANFDLWVKPNDVSNKIWEWVCKPDLRPNTGSLIQVLFDKKHGTVFQLAR